MDSGLAVKFIARRVGYLRVNILTQRRQLFLLLHYVQQWATILESPSSIDDVDVPPLNIQYLCGNLLYLVVFFPYPLQHLTAHGIPRQPPHRFNKLLLRCLLLISSTTATVLLLNCTPDARCCACRVALYVPPRSPFGRLNVHHCSSVPAASCKSFAI